MTVREYITGKLSNFGINISESDFVDIYTIVDPDSDITPDTRLYALRAIAIMIIPQLLLRAESISENGFSMSWDKDALLKYYAWLCNELGIDNTLTGTVKDITALW